MATGSMTLTGRVSSSSADYFGNGTQNGKESLVFHCDLSGTRPPANCVTFSITSITFSIKCTECGTSKYRGTIYLGSSAMSGRKLGVTPYKSGNDAGSITWSGSLSGWDISASTLANLTTYQFYLTNCESGSTGRKIYCKSSYGASSITINYTYTTFQPTLVVKGDPIKIADYNQMQAAYSSLAVTQGSTITKAQIDSVAALDGDVVTATQGAVITADYFNTNVLNKIIS